MDKEQQRAAFEKWAASKGQDLSTFPDGGYRSLSTNAQCVAWQAALSQPASAPAAQGEPVPEGYCLALKEPTWEMEQAGAAAGRKYLQETGGNSPRVIYQAMLAAAPKEPNHD